MSRYEGREPPKVTKTLSSVPTDEASNVLLNFLESEGRKIQADFHFDSSHWSDLYRIAESLSPSEQSRLDALKKYSPMKSPSPHVVVDDEGQSRVKDEPSSQSSDKEAKRSEKEAKKARKVAKKEAKKAKKEAKKRKRDS